MGWREEEARQGGGGGRCVSGGAYSYVGERRQKAPGETGTADVSVVCTLRLSEEEIANVKLDSNEYEKHEWFPPTDVVNDESKHPALRRAVKDLQLTIRLRELKDAMGELSDAEIGKRVRTLL